MTSCNFKNEDNLPKFGYDIPEIKKKIEFNSLLNIKGVKRRQGFETTVCLAEFDLIDSVRNLIGKVRVGRNPYIHSVGYNNYRASDLYYQKLSQGTIYDFNKKIIMTKYYSCFIYSFSYLNTAKGEILISKLSVKPDKVPDKKLPVTTNVDTFDFYVYNTNFSIIQYSMIFLMDSQEIDFNYYTTDTSMSNVKKLLEPVVNTMTIK